MREIKFQCIYRPTGEKFEPTKIDFVNKIVYGSFDNNKTNYCYYSLEPDGKGDAWLREYTGLQDKNEKEIYKGDAVHCAISSADRTHFIRDYTAVVEQDICNPCFVLKQENGEVEYDFVMCNLMILEVIGNIYENHEFLTEAE